MHVKTIAAYNARSSFHHVILFILLPSAQLQEYLLQGLQSGMQSELDIESDLKMQAGHSGKKYSWGGKVTLSCGHMQ